MSYKGRAHLVRRIDWEGIESLMALRVEMKE